MQEGRAFRNNSVVRLVVVVVVVVVARDRLCPSNYLTVGLYNLPLITWNLSHLGQIDKFRPEARQTSQMVLIRIRRLSGCSKT